MELILLEQLGLFLDAGTAASAEVIGVEICGTALLALMSRGGHEILSLAALTPDASYEE